MRIVTEFSSLEASIEEIIDTVDKMVTFEDERTENKMRLIYEALCQFEKDMETWREWEHKCKLEQQGIEF